MPTSLARVSTLQQSNAAQAQIQTTEAQLQQVQNEISTGKRVIVPSDDPGDASMIMELQKSLEKSTVYNTNLTTAQSQLSQTDSTLGSLTTLVQQAQSIASSDVGSTTTDAERAADADIVQSIYTQSLSLANTQFNGVYLFGGNNATSSPFVDNGGGIEFTGSDTVLQNAVDTNASLALQVSASSVFGSFSSRVQGTADLTPSVSTDTRLVDLGGAGGSGVQLGSIQIQDGSVSQTVNLAGADNLGDVINDINAAHIGGVTASLNAASNGITLSGTATENIQVSEVGGGNTAQSLGILNTAGNGAGNPVVGSSLQAKLTDLTPVTALKGGAGIDLTSGITITNGTKSATVSFAGATNVQDMLNDINGSGTGVKAQINAAGTGIDILNATQGLTLTIGENGGTTAADLGVRSFGPDTPLSELNNSKGVGTVAGADFQITSTTGATFSVDLDSSDTTVQDVINSINSAATAAGVGVSASFATTGNGINLSDTSGGTGQLGVTALNFSTAAADLGLTGTPASQSQINGTDVNGIQTSGVFSDLANLRDALQSNDQAAITAAGTQLQNDYNRVVDTRGSNGATIKEAQSRQDQISTETLATQSLLSSLQDADITSTVTQFQTLQTSMQATLETQARTLSISLLDFLS